MRRLAFSLALVLVACGGGGGGAGGGRAAQQMGTAQLTLAYAPSGSSAASSSRHAMYVDPLTQSVGVSVNGTAAQITNVGSSSPTCTTSGTTVTCTIDISAPYGNDTFAISLYSGTNGSGSVIGTASASGDVTAGSAFVINASVSSNYLAYLSVGTSGIELFNESGALQSTINIRSDNDDLDDAGNLYNVYPATTYPGAASTVQVFPPNSTTATATYQPSYPNVGLIDVSGTGQFLTADYYSGGFVFDVWAAGHVGGTPSFTITPAGQVFSFTMQHDGTLYVADFNGTTFQYDVYPPGSSTPTRSIPETIVPVAQQGYFEPNDSTIGPDGTLYVCEFNYGIFGGPDTMTGLYIYPPSGPERFVATTSDANGGGAQGVMLDAAGNIYVANSNAIVNINTCSPGPCQWSADTLHDIEVFSPGGSSVLRHITGGFDAYQLSVTPSGTIFFDSINEASGTNAATYYVAANSPTPVFLTPFFASEIPLFDGVQQLQPYGSRRRLSMQSGSAAAHGVGTVALARYLPSLIQQRVARLRASRKP